MQEGAGQKLAAGAVSQDAVGAYGDATSSATGGSVTISGLEFPRYFSTVGSDPFDEVEWELRDAIIGNERGTVVFEQRGVEMPKPQAMGVLVARRMAATVGAMSGTSARSPVMPARARR